MRRHPISEPPPDTDRYLVSNGEKVFIASCRSFGGGKPAKPDWWPEGDHSETKPLVWWSKLPRAK